MSDEDALEYLFRRIHEKYPGLDINELKHEARVMYGGSRQYIKKDPTYVKTVRLASAIRHGVPIGKAINQSGMSRATLYRLLGRKAWKIKP